jgi:predicted HNH restriction endonuclease
MPAVIAENDESLWSDETGILYHFPKRYEGLLLSGTIVLYYKGRLRDTAYGRERLSKEPHYFGVGTIGSVHPDPASNKGDLFATIESYQRFERAVLAKKQDGTFYEQISPNRESNFWRDGVRATTEEVFHSVLRAAGHELIQTPRAPQPDDADDLLSGQEGRPTMRYVTTYERDPAYRRQALSVHGYCCKGCGVSMSEMYGPYAEGLIHIHHVQPVSTYEGPRRIDPSVDLVPLCPNCHAVVHFRKDRTLSVEELRAMVSAAVAGRGAGL